MITLSTEFVQKIPPIVVEGHVTSMERTQESERYSRNWMDVTEIESGEVIQHLPAAGIPFGAARVRITIEFIE